jgi:hypothetical protein
MAISEARRRANEKYNIKAYEEIKVRVKKGQKNTIKHAAGESGESVNTYINRAIDERMSVVGGSSGFSPTDSIPKGMSRFFSHTELEKMFDLLQEGQTIEDYIRIAVLDRINADTASGCLQGVDKYIQL